MRKRDLESSLFWMGFSILFMIGSLQQGLIRGGLPGPGFLPFIVSIILVGLSLMVLIPALRKKEEVPLTKEIFTEKGTRKRIMLAIVSLFGYGISLKYGGYVLTTFVFMLFMSRLIESISWIKLFILSLLTAIISYLFFLALEVQLPQGIFGI